VLAVLGLILGVTQFRRTKPFRLSAAVPYRGWMRWHYILGAVFGLFALTWVFSGLMSMEPFAWMNAEGLYISRDALSGGPADLAEFVAAKPSAIGQSLQQPNRVKEIEYRRILDRPYLLAHVSGDESSPNERERLHQPYPFPASDPDGEILIEAVSMTARREGFDVATLVDRLASEVPGVAVREAELLEDYDSYYYSQNAQAPLPILRIKFDDPADTWYYVDPALGEIVARAHKFSRLERWLFNGLHSLDFSFWYTQRPLWDIGMIVLSLGALGTSLLGLYLGLKRVRRDIAGLRTKRLRAAAGEPAG